MPRRSHSVGRLWLAAAVALPAAITLTAYGVAEFGPQPEVAVSPITTSISVPELVNTISTTPFWSEELIRRGDTLNSVLARLDVEDEQALAFVRSDRSARPFFDLRAGRMLRALRAPDGTLLELSYVTPGLEQLSLKRAGTSYRVTQAPVALTREVMLKSGQIRSSLFAATDAAGLPDDVTQQLINLFEGEIDFHRKLQKGDRFGVVYEVETLDGREVKAGRILAAEFVNNGNVLEAMWFDDGNGGGGYYRPDGRSLKKSFLQTPVEFSRISSGFSVRLHPILKTWKAHKGIDYAAPTGTKIRAVADGVITTAGYKGAYGNMIEIRHSGKYSTLYGHMNGFAPGIRSGMQIKQGDLIGYVGSTGRSTGPHLHYEFKVAGTQVDPTKIELPRLKSLDPRQMARFREASRQYQNKLALLSRTAVASAE
ncbi:peptidoglycan DD-metalloendopeptidase family protein [Chitinibacteraceae bacterium HSL-7]